MADYFQRFLTPEVPRLFLQIEAARDVAASRRLLTVAHDLELLMIRLSAQFEALAVATAAEVNARAVAILNEKRKRPETDSSPHLADVIESRVERGPLGEVGIADLESLARARRRGRTTDGEYWRAQEFGLSEGFVGRRLHGVFMPSETAPGPFDDDTGFDVTPSHGEGGWMTIRNPIEPKHFLTEAVKWGAARYQRELLRIVRRAEDDIVKIMSRIPATAPAAAPVRRAGPPPRRWTPRMGGV